MFAIMVYDKPPTRMQWYYEQTHHQGPDEYQFTCGVHGSYDGRNYALNNDTQDKMVVFGPDQEGDVAPARMLQPPHAARHR
jgi:hypothetical protein